MSQVISFNGSNYTIPDVNDTDWGQNVTDFLVALPNGILQPQGGLFSLAADVDFGANFGLESIYYKSRTANESASGVVRLARVDSVGWRNNANSADLLLSVDASDQLTFNGIVIESDTLADGSIFVGNASGESTGVVMSGDIGIINSGLTAIQAGVIVDADVNANAAIALTKLAPFGATSRMLYDDVSGVIAVTDWTWISGVLTTGAEGVLRYLDSGSNYVSFKAPASVTATYDLTLPTTAPAADEFLRSDGAGNLSWATLSGSGTVSAGLIDEVAYYPANGNTVNGSSVLSITGGQILGSDGTALLPTWSFSSDPNSGLFHAVAADRIEISTGGVSRISIGNGGISSAVHFATVDGSASAPGFRFDSDSDTGLYLPGTANRLAISTGGVAHTRFQENGNIVMLRSGGKFYASDGTVALPSISFVNASSNGFFISGSITRLAHSGVEYYYFGGNLTKILANNPVFGSLHLTNSSGVHELKARKSDDTGYASMRYDATQHIFQTGGSEMMRISTAITTIDNDLLMSRATAGNIAFIELVNTDNTNVNSRARISMSTGGASAGDPYLLWTISGVQSWSAGIDNSDGDKWKLNSSASLTNGSSLEVNLSSQLLGLDGTALLPTWSFSGDPNTGLYTPAGDQVGISCNGTLTMDIAPTAVNIYMSGTWEYQFNANAFIPAVDNVNSNGTASARWSDVRSVLINGADYGFANGYIMREYPCSPDDVQTKSDDWMKKNAAIGIQLLNKEGVQIARFEHDGIVHANGFKTFDGFDVVAKVKSNEQKIKELENEVKLLKEAA